MNGLQLAARSAGEFAVVLEAAHAPGTAAASAACVIWQHVKLRLHLFCSMSKVCTYDGL